MAPLRILILSDGRPGHFNLSEGVAAAIGRLGAVDVTRIDAKRGRWPGHLLAAMTRARLPSAKMLRVVYGIAPTSIKAADVIISAGAETLAANIWLARLQGCPNIFYGSLRWFSPYDFSLVLTSYARKAARHRHALALKPSKLDPDALRQRPAPSSRAPAPPRRIAMLVGGDAGTVHYTDADWAELIGLMKDASASAGVRWLVANSRRTPAAVSDTLAKLAADGSGTIECWVDVRTAGPGTLAPLLAAADAAICTEDSSSMVSECVWARLPVVSLRPARSTLSVDEAAYRAWLIDSGWCLSRPIAGITPRALVDALVELRPISTNPQQALAELIAERVPELISRHGLTAA